MLQLLYLFFLSFKVCVFTPESPAPLSVHEDVCHTPLLGAVFLKDARAQAEDGRREEEEGDPHWSDSSSLYFLSPEQVTLTRRVWGWHRENLSHSKVSNSWTIHCVVSDGDMQLHTVLVCRYVCTYVCTVCMYNTLILQVYRTTVPQTLMG